jgi:RNA polymerase sigma factor (sigma-70 family)
VDESEATITPATVDTVTPTADTGVTAEFETFYREFLPVLVGFLRWQGVPLTDAADLAQETMMQAYRKWSTIKHPQAWSRRVASRMWARHLAVACPRDPIADVADVSQVLLTIPDVDAWEQRHQVLAALDTLPPRQRQVLAWTLDGYTPTEIGAELQIEPSAVRSSLLLARRAVAAFLTRGGDDD